MYNLGKIDTFLRTHNSSRKNCGRIGSRNFHEVVRRLNQLKQKLSRTKKHSRIGGITGELYWIFRELIPKTIRFQTINEEETPPILGDLY